MRPHTALLALAFLGASCTNEPKATKASTDAGGAAAAKGGTTKLVGGGGAGGVAGNPGGGGGQPGSTTPTFPPGTDFITSSGVPVSISLQSVNPGGVDALRSSGVIRFAGTLPVRYRIDFAAPPGHEDECPSPITGVATQSTVPFTATLLQKPGVAEHYVIDVVVVIIDGANAGSQLRCPSGLVVYPALPDTGKRGAVAATSGS